MNLEKLTSTQIFDMAEFVVSENFKHHFLDMNSLGFTNEVNSVYDEELTYFGSSNIFVGKECQGSIHGSIRVMKWNYVDPLPLQKIFGINPFSCVDTSKIFEIFHIGRFAIKKELPSLQLFKQLVLCAIAPVCEHKKNVAFAECDRKLLRVLSMLGIKIVILGKSLNYLGSETIPILLKYEGLVEFYRQNLALISDAMINELTDGYRERLAI